MQGAVEPGVHHLMNSMTQTESELVFYHENLPC